MSSTPNPCRVHVPLLTDMYLPRCIRKFQLFGAFFSSLHIHEITQIGRKVIEVGGANL